MLLSAVLQGGPLRTGETIAWSSDLQLVIAVGNGVEATFLLPGVHSLRAELRRDQDVLASSPPVTLTVSDRTGAGLRVVGRLDPGGGDFADLWLESDLVALGTRSRNAYLIDVTAPESPLLVAEVPALPGGAQDLHLTGEHVFLQSGEIYDIGEPAAPRMVGDLRLNTYDVTVSGGRLYSSPGGGTPGSGIDGFRCLQSGVGVEIFDVGLPEAPVPIGRFTAKGDAHELQERDGVLYGAFCGGFCSVDVSDPTRPQILGCGTRGTHSAFRHPSRPLVFTTDEFAVDLNGFGPDPRVHVWDVSSLASPVHLAEFRSLPSSASHQVWASGDLLYVAGYGRGVEVVDVSDPRSPRLIAFYDTFPGAANTFDGVWGVVVDEEGLIYAADTATGLWIFALE